MHTTSTVLMIRPVNFAFNEQTATSNTFQDRKTKGQNVHTKAVKEFDNFVKVLRANGLEVITIDDQPEPHTPDSIFPNNWISTHPDGKVFIYPMEARNRRFERRPEILEELRNRFKIESEIDLTYLEAEGKYLEGTGSMVLDRKNHLAYACISPRTSRKALEIFSDLSGYKTVTFQAFSRSGKPIYHTNVMMCIAEMFAVICLEAIPGNDERVAIVERINASEKEVIEITCEQMNHFAGNMLQLKSTNGENLLIMSQQAKQCLSAGQLNKLTKFCRIVSSPLYTIESSGGGSARCMIAEIYLQQR